MSFAYKISAFNRKRKWKTFLETLKPSSKDKILDIGFSEKEYSKTDNFLEKNYPYQKNIIALGIDKPVKFLKRYPKLKAVQYYGQKFPFKIKGLISAGQMQL